MNSDLTLSSNLGMLLNQQMVQGAFDFLNENLGKDLINNIPTIFLSPEVDNCDYPTPWKKANDLPADVVKGILPITKRPFLAIRYFDTVIKEYTLEFFFQRYSNEIKPATNIYHLNTMSHIIAELPATSCTKNWTSSSLNSSISKGYMTDEKFEIVKNILCGRELEKTDGKYLSIYKDNFIKV